MPTKCRNARRLRLPQCSSCRRIRIMSIIMVNELWIYGAYWLTRPAVNHGYDHAGWGTATIAMGYLVECDPSSAAGILAPAHLHVVRHRRGRPDGAGGLARRHQHRAGPEPAARLYTKLLDHFHSSSINLDR